MSKILKSIFLSLQQLKLRCQFVIFCSIFAFTAIVARSILWSYRDTSAQIEQSKFNLQQQQTWLSKGPEICSAFTKIVSKIEEQNQCTQLSLLADIEEVISNFDCRYELSNESRSTYDDVTISCVWVTLYDTDIETLVELCSDIDAKNVNLSEMHVRASKNGLLNVKCLVEAIDLVRK